MNYMNKIYDYLASDKVLTCKLFIIRKLLTTNMQVAYYKKKYLQQQLCKIVHHKDKCLQVVYYKKKYLQLQLCKIVHHKDKCFLIK